MKRVFFSFIVILLCFSLFQQCKKDGKCLGYIKFTDEIKRIIPYKGNETLIFADSSGGIARFHIDNYGSGYNYFWIGKGMTGYNSSEYDYYMIEETGGSGETDDILQIDLNFSSPLESQQYIILHYWFLLKNQYTEIKGGGEGKCGVIPGKLYEINDGSKLTNYDTLTILNKKFYSVYRMDYSSVLTDSSEHIVTTFYNFENGIVGFKTNKGRRWCLQ